MKKLILAFLCVSLIIVLFIPAAVGAVYDGNYILENNGSLTDGEVAELNAKAAEIYNSTGFNVCFLLTDDTGDDYVYDYIEKKYKAAAGEENGIAIGIDTEKQKGSFYCSGKADTIITEDREETLWNLVNGDDTWYNCIAAYIDTAGGIFKSEVTEAEGDADAAGISRLVDEADLLTADEESMLTQKLDETSERLGCDIVVVTTNTLVGKSPMEYADDYYDYHGYSQDGALLLISMEDRDWYISTSGECITAITDAGLDYMSERFLNDLSNGKYYKAFNIFADSCEEFIIQARKGNPYDIGNIPKNKTLDEKWIVYALVFGIVAAIIVTGSMKSKLKSVYYRSAANYVKSDSLKLTKYDDIFLYSHIDRTERESERSSGGSSTHTSSSGSTHGGGGGKF